MRYLVFALTMLPTLAVAAPYDRPIPQSQSAPAEFWFGLASVALIVALFCVYRMVSRR
ncbi:protein NnrT [Cohaesibacter sp. ES.047]|uniref:protein NnrT n=1 Tax=Cohaesibacter sp. ES.047 TaxID=1798205 RepID=UPI000BB6E15B|nr:protein NnrT [Cohaesibacter sp. ES.047]